MREITEALIFDTLAGPAGEYVDADLIKGVTWEEICEAQAAWGAAMERLVASFKASNVPRNLWPQHSHWDWRPKYLIGEIEGQRCFGIRLKEQMQGLMLVKPNERSKLVPKRARMVYIEYIATAPWNVTYEGVQDGRYGVIGHVLFGAADKLSDESGFEGRVGLHALPQAAEWYERRGMIEVRAAMKEGLRYFELTPEAARQFLEG